MQYLHNVIRPNLSRLGLLAPFLLGLLLLGAGTNVRAETLTVAVAANVKYAFAELAQTYQRETGVDVEASYGASGSLAAQIRNGAPFDLFLSANMKYPQTLYDEKLAADAPRVYVYGVLVLWTMNPLDLKQGLPVLGGPAVSKIAVANPKLAPYGVEAIKALKHFKLYDQLAPKLVYGESISQVSQYILSGAADIGITAKSVVLAPSLQGKGRWVDVPADSYQPIAQGMVILKHGEAAHAKAVQRFVAFLASPAARAIFKKFGYRLP